MAGSYAPDLVREFTAAGWWGTRGLLADVAQRAAAAPHATAFTTADRRIDWHSYHATALDLARVLTAAGAAPGTAVAVLLPDGIGVHTAFLATEAAGVTAVGIPYRSGDAEIRDLVERGGARIAVTDGTRAIHGTDGVTTVTVDAFGAAPAALPRAATTGPALGPDGLYLLNATSGTTGRPKIVAHTQNRWRYFAGLAVDAGRLTPDDVFASIVPAPYGFGLWSGHLVPTLLGAPCVLTPRFDADETLDLLARERVTVLAAVTTQLIMLLDRLDRRAAEGRPLPDLSALRVVFTGGERVPYECAAEFEDRTGAAVLQFYGANETGAVSRTTLDDPRDKRLRTAGRPVPAMHVRLFDEAGHDVTATGGPGVPGVRGPAMGPGYWQDPAADAALVRDDGWMLMGDLAQLDADGYLTVTGRTADFVVRGGKNISAPAVEEHVATHPAVVHVAVVAAPDPVFGERACAYVVTRPGTTLGLDALRAHLGARGVSREWWPEHLVTLPELPCSAGGKIAKAQLREDAARRFG